MKESRIGPPSRALLRGKRRPRGSATIGLVASAPTLNSEIGRHGQISGNFTRREVESLVKGYQSGLSRPKGGRENEN